MKYVILSPSYAEQQFLANDLPTSLVQANLQRGNAEAKACNCQLMVATSQPQLARICDQAGIATHVIAKYASSTFDCLGQIIDTLNYPDSAVIINWAGAELQLTPDFIGNLTNALLAANKFSIAVPVIEFSAASQIFDTRIVKAVLKQNNEVMYFSRAAIPYLNHKFNYNDIVPLAGEDLSCFKRYLGIFACTAATIKHVCNLDEAPLELLEQVDEIRWLWYQLPTFAINCPQLLPLSVKLNMQAGRLLDLAAF